MHTTAYLHHDAAGTTRLGRPPPAGTTAPFDLMSLGYVSPLGVETHKQFLAEADAGRVTGSRRGGVRVGRMFASAGQRLWSAVAPSAGTTPVSGLAEAVLETTGALVLVCDRDGRTLEANPAMQRFAGRTAEELIGTPFWEVVVIPEEVQLARVAVADVLAGGAQIPAEVDWLAAGGARRRVELQTSVLRDGHGRAQAVAFVGVDVTVHRQREARYQHQAMHDDLTGVANRGALFNLLERALDANTGNGCGLLLCDLDDFKAVNDTWGHAVGDQLLIAVAGLRRTVAGQARRRTCRSTCSSAGPRGPRRSWGR
jgi:PAS domain S-box-containing protein